MNSTETLINIVSILITFFGLIVCFFGYRVFRFLLIVAGMVVGASCAAGAVLTLTESKDIIIVLAAALAGGLVLAIILLFLYSVGVFLLGVLFALALFSGIIALKGLNIEHIIYVIPALVGGIIALFFQKFTIIIITSITGALISIVGALYLIDSQFNLFDPQFINNMGDMESYRILLGWIALSVLGIAIQYFISRKSLDIPQENDKEEENHS